MNRKRVSFARNEHGAYVEFYCVDDAGKRFGNPRRLYLSRKQRTLIDMDIFPALDAENTNGKETLTSTIQIHHEPMERTSPIDARDVQARYSARNIREREARDFGRKWKHKRRHA